MNISYLYSMQCAFDLTRLGLFVVPEWMQVGLKAQGLTPEHALDFHNQSEFSSIFSGKDVIFHDQVSYLANELLFGEHKYVLDKASYEEKFAELESAWFALPFQSNPKLNLHPVVMSSNMIGLINYQGEDADKVCGTNIYERLLQCVHRLTVNRIGMRAWDNELARCILEKIRVSRQAA